MNLINKTDILTFRPISKSVKEVTINTYIEDAQNVDLLPLIGEKFYFDILNNPNNYSDLLNEYPYQYKSENYVNPGLKRVLSLFTTARYFFHGTQTDTPFGFVEKGTPDSIPVSRTNRKEIYKKEQQVAMSYWSQVKNYLDRNSEEYPLWDVDCGSKKRRFRWNKITI